ncbi:hypothetical protein AD998_08270 [bacterium 336/3]|jgi:two-component system, LytTR family, response regulator|nr:hypothetical protein AD998_08270 [bacterium 336/3]
MTSLSAIIIDDEIQATKTLELLIENYYSSEVNIVAKATSCVEAIAQINQFEPDIVFLDISMPNGSGFDLFNYFPTPYFEVIFTTAYNQYALPAIKVSAIDYLLKPIDIDELGSAIQKVKTKLKKQEIVAPLGNKSIALPFQEGFVFVNITDIIYCKGDDNYTVFYMQNGEKHIVSKTLKEYERMLPSQYFIRIHRSYLIQISYMKKYLKGAGGYVEMSNNDVLPVSRNKKESLLMLMNY